MTRLSFKGQGDQYPVWTPNAKHIVFKSPGAGDFSLQWVRADGARDAQQLLESKNELRPYAFSPDGKLLAYAEANAETGLDLWILPLDIGDPDHPKAGKPELFLRTPFDEFEPAFSLDGRWIAYASSESGRAEVYVRPFPTGSGKWLVSTNGGRLPIWSPASRELFYETPDNRIMVTTYTAKDDSFAAGKPRPWSDAQVLSDGPWRNLDLAQDGKRFAVFLRPEVPGEQKSLHVTFLLNFFDELRRRIPANKK